jgi:hypothetical protein
MTDQPGYQGRSGTGPDPIPLLPRGQILFEALPLKAVVLEPLAPALGHGALVVRDHDRGAVVLVRDGALVEVHAFSGGVSRSGESVLTDVQGWSDAVVSAHRLDPLLVDVCESLLRGEIIYTDLRLDWVDWSALLADFGRRSGAYALEIFTPAGRGVTCVAAGQQALSYTDIHPEHGDPALLEAMAANKEGSIRVRRINAATFAAPTLSAAQMSSAPSPAVAAPPSAAESAPQAQPAPTGDHTNGASRSETPVGAEQAAPVPEAQRTPERDEVLPDLTWVAPWQTPWRDEPTAGAVELAGEHTPAAPPSVGDVLGDLRSIAQRRLQMSASRVEAILDEAAHEHRSLASVLEEIRAMSIRGVMPATVDAMVAEMSAAATEHRSA